MEKTFVLFALSFFVSAAHANELQISALPVDGCPTAIAVRSELTRLLPVLPANDAEISLVDEGDHFSLTLAGTSRSFVDPDRNCDERARTAAVAIAFAIAPPSVQLQEPLKRADAPVTVRASPAPSSRSMHERFFLSAGVSGEYFRLDQRDFGAAKFDFEVGAQFRRWSIAARTSFKVGGDGSPDDGFPPYVDVTAGPAVALKLGTRVRLHLAVTLGWAAANYWGMVVAVDTDVSVDLFRRDRQTLYVAAGPSYEAHVLRQAVLVESIPGVANEFGVRVGLGYRFGR